MNALDQAQMAYSSPAAPVKTARSTEHEALVSVTRAIKQAQSGPGKNFKSLATALYKNRQLWTIFAASVADPENKLPETLRANLFYLAEFTNHHTSLVLAGKADAEPLIEINTSVMTGLRDGSIDK